MQYTLRHYLTAGKFAGTSEINFSCAISIVYKGLPDFWRSSI
jgi:hypothetical protein